MTFRTNYARAIWFLLLCAAFIWLTYSLTRLPGLYERIVGWVALPLTILGTFKYMALLITGGATVVISDTGIADSRLGQFEIAWNDIIAADVVTKGRARYLKLTLRDPSSYIEKMSVINRLLSRFVIAIGLSPFAMSFVDLTPGIDDALPAISTKLGRADT